MRPPSSTLFPYTTLFRSVDRVEASALTGLTVGGGCAAKYSAARLEELLRGFVPAEADRKSTRLNSSHVEISYAVFCLKKKIGSPQRRTAHGRAPRGDGEE